MTYLIDVVFWIAVALVAYVYAGYPILAYVVGRLFPKHVDRMPFEPTVSLIITAYNEERDIHAKLQNTLRLEYPKEKLEIIVVSDCSSDRTDEIVREFAPDGVRLLRQTMRSGKTSAQNAAVGVASGEVILFSDATSMYEENVLREIMPDFADAEVGCVAGRLIYVDDGGSGVGKGAKNYWSYETFLKENESRASSLIGVSGCIYAVRRSAYVPMYEEACSDFLICTIVYRQGLRTVYHPAAVCYEATNTRTAEEFRMRVRIISQTFTDLWRNRDMLDPRNAGFYSVQLISHKLLRYAVPLFLVIMFAASGLLAADSMFYAVVFAVQALFYFVAVVDWAIQKWGIDLRFAAIPRYFCLANLASAAGFYKFLKGERFARWEPIRD